MGKILDKIMDSRQELVNIIIENMKNGYVFTEKMWNDANLRPHNPTSDVIYRGGNSLKLALIGEVRGYEDPRWMTFIQAKDNGYSVEKGEKGVLLEKWIFTKKEEQKNKLGEIEKVEVDLKNPICNTFYVFNARQLKGIEPFEMKKLERNETLELAEKLIQSSECPIKERAIRGAYYNPGLDEIILPLKDTFKSPEAYLSVALHEMAHSTGHRSRLYRPLMNRFGTPDYAKEELNAEISCMFTQADLGIKLKGEMMQDHTNYLKSWIKVLEEDPNELFRACTNAEKISTRLISNFEYQQSVEHVHLKDEPKVHSEFDKVQEPGKQDITIPKITITEVDICQTVDMELER